MGVFVTQSAVLIPFLCPIITGCARPPDQHPHPMEPAAASPRLPPGHTELEPYYIRNSLPDPVLVTLPDARDLRQRAILVIHPGEEKGIPYPSDNFCGSLSRGPQVPSEIPSDVTVRLLDGSAKGIVLLRDDSGVYVIRRAPAAVNSLPDLGR